MEKITKIRKRDVNADVEMFNKKLKTWLFEGKELNLKPNCEFKDGKIFMKCIKCEIFLPRTTEFFHGNSTMYFKSSEPGHESLNNSIKSPCKKCYSILQKVNNQMNKECSLNSLLTKYKMLTREWFDNKLIKQNRRGIITNVKLILTGSNMKNRVGIHRYKNNLEHTPENVFLEVQELNVQQRDAIPCLIEAWIQVFTHLLNIFEDDDNNIDYLQLFRDQYHKTPKDLSINYKNGTKI